MHMYMYMYMYVYICICICNIDYHGVNISGLPGKRSCKNFFLSIKTDTKVFLTTSCGTVLRFKNAVQTNVALQILSLTVSRIHPITGTSRTILFFNCDFGILSKTLSDEHMELKANPEDSNM